jgi:hypothetical protein
MALFLLPTWEQEWNVEHTVMGKGTARGSVCRHRSLATGDPAQGPSASDSPVDNKDWRGITQESSMPLLPSEPLPNHPVLPRASCAEKERLFTASGTFGDPTELPLACPPRSGGARGRISHGQVG